MKIFLRSFNGVLDELGYYLQQNNQLTDNPHEADIAVLWQDVRGHEQRIATMFKETLRKPVIVIQHGRGATRDYDKPNAFPLVADLFLAWGPAEKQRLERLGFGAHCHVVGSPLFKRLIPRQPHDGKRVLFVPIIMEKEEPENLLVYAKLKEWESKKLFNRILNDKKLKTAWAQQIITFKDEAAHQQALKQGNLNNVQCKTEIKPNIPPQLLYKDGIICAKLTGLHDQQQYLCEKLVTDQNSENHIQQLVQLLSQTDVVVTIEEGTLSLLATALNIPVIHADVYKYTTYGGMPYGEVEKIRVESSHHISKIQDLKDLPDLLDYVINTPEKGFIQQLRIKVCEDELGPQYGDATKNILNEITSLTEMYNRNTRQDRPLERVV